LNDKIACYLETLNNNIIENAETRLAEVAEGPAQAWLKVSASYFSRLPRASKPK